MKGCSLVVEPGRVLSYACFTQKEDVISLYIGAHVAAFYNTDVFTGLCLGFRVRLVNGNCRALL